MPWISVEYDCGNTVLVFKHFSTRYGSSGQMRYNRREDGKTTKMQKACNDRRMELKYDVLANANFKKGDYFLTLTFKRGELPKLPDGKPDIERIKRIWKRYRAKLREVYRRQGKELKYIYSFQYDGCRPHFHMLCNNDGVNIADFPKWKYGNPDLKWLDDRKYHSIGEYFARGTPVTVKLDDGTSAILHKKGKLGCSRNLIRPEPKYRRLRRASWNKEPKARTGFYISALENGYIYNPYNKGYYPFQFYRMVRQI